MNYQVFVRPPLLSRWLKPRDKRRRILTLELEPDFLKDGRLRLDIDIAFKPVPVAPDIDFGSTMIRVEVNLEDGRIDKHTPEQVITSQDKIAIRHKRKARVRLRPAVNHQDAEVTLGEISLQNGEDRVFKSEYTGKPRKLVPVREHNSVLWEFVDSESIFRDYLIGNLPLYLISHWDDPQKGSIALSGDARLFYKRRDCGFLRSLYMKYVLWKRGIPVRRPRLRVTFENRQD